MKPVIHSIRCHDGRTLRVTEGGDLSGWPILVHHITPLSGQLDPLHLRYGQDHGIRLIGYDRPGYGGSDRRPGRIVADAADDATTITDALGISRFAVWGHSGGGPHALACAALLPGRVSAVAASASVAPYGAEGLDWLAGMGDGNVDEFRAAIAGSDALERFLRPGWLAMQAGNEELSPELRTLLEPEDFELLAGEFGAYLGSAAKDGMMPGLSGYIDDDLAFVRPWGFGLENLGLPVSIWHGKRDRFVPHEHGVWLTDHITGSELKLFDGETHLTFLHRRASEVFDWLVTRSSR